MNHKIVMVGKDLKDQAQLCSITTIEHVLEH